jgi:hypothetical protein
MNKRRGSRNAVSSRLLFLVAIHQSMSWITWMRIQIIGLWPVRYQLLFVTQGLVWNSCNSPSRCLAMYNISFSQAQIKDDRALTFRPVMRSVRFRRVA